MFLRISVRQQCVRSPLGLDERCFLFLAGLPSFDFIWQQFCNRNDKIYYFPAASYRVLPLQCAIIGLLEACLVLQSIDQNKPMEQSSSSESIIYLSPTGPRYPLKDPPNNLLDEPAPPHFQNRFDLILTPERQPRSPSHQLEKSSSSKPLPLPVRPQHSATHPFAHFEDDHLDPAILSKGKEEAERGSPSCEPTVRKRRKYDEVMISNMLVSPKKRVSREKVVKEEPNDYLGGQYQELLQQLRLGQEFTIPEPFFFRGEEDTSLSKLLCFELNAKNGRYVKYDPITKTCHSIYKCLGCNRTFTVAAALGGHLSKCPDKLIHLERTQKQPRSRPYKSIPDGHDSPPEEEVEMEVQVKLQQEQGPIVIKKQPAEPAYRRGRRTVRTIRTRSMRPARLRANSFVQRVVQAHFE